MEAATASSDGMTAFPLSATTGHFSRYDRLFFSLRQVILPVMAGDFARLGRGILSAPMSERRGLGCAIGSMIERAASAYSTGGSYVDGGIHGFAAAMTPRRQPP